ncbi:SAM-dependent methyltransferase [Psychrosphaera sp. B3R10]|uniref:tRNA (guanine(46)-N(7))-methyltransferase TrmB n=1 Tax=unclassified Psychrosphaera TaxID=2641570 RepID=UPI001C0A66B6|nr:MULTISPECIES: SAM-dependent methyltransferase [unclassified Psychrosphaera]MBU2882419.1 SAM-dependent methyltransferase [Psychrosphaera sp. I2R16]MBU2990238.1 SAM-dependent methyltransferase [Psychrosphaera sp. B3R10]
MESGEGNSRAVTSNQTGVHDDLVSVVDKHLNTQFKKPYAAFSIETFEQIRRTVNAFLQDNPAGTIILDSCCGVGESAYHHARSNPASLVIAIDKSEHRIEKQEHHGQASVTNCFFFRGDLNDLWRLISVEDWPISHHYILYPNPWPKSKHLGRRWHGSPVFKNLPKIGKRLIVRSNWSIYIEEFVAALKQTGIVAQMQEYKSDTAITPFERKYWASGQKSYQLDVRLDGYFD